MQASTLFTTSMLALFAVSATAASSTPISAETKAAQARYQADRTLCNEEPTSAQKMQCRRDAKAEYDRALAAARAKAKAATSSHVTPAARPAAATCAECGVVTAVAPTERAGEATALGTIAGGIGGALLGNQVGGGTGKDLATLAGAVAGGYAGRKIEEQVKSHTVWVVTVQYSNGDRRNFEFAQDPGLQVGESVRNAGESIVRQLPPQ